MSLGLWTKAISADALQETGRAVVDLNGRQLLILRGSAGLFACNNRCPQDGSPLAEGRLEEDGILSCTWNNCRYDLFSGASLAVGDTLRVYPVEETDGEVFVDLSEPPKEERFQTALLHLCDAFDRHDYGRLARELARFQQLEFDPLDALRAAVGWSCDRFEFGMGQAFAGAADWLRLLEERPNAPTDCLICLMEAIGHIARDVLREKIFPYNALEQRYDPMVFLQAVEAEDEAQAVSQIRGALAEGLGFAKLETVLTEAALAHYGGAAHPLALVPRAGRLIARLGEDFEARVVLPLVRAIVCARREDRTAQFQGLLPALSAWIGNTQPGFSRNKLPRIKDYRYVDVEGALALTLEYKQAEPKQLYQRLLGACAYNLLSFDIAYDQQIDGSLASNIGWHDFSGAVVFANALRAQAACAPGIWPAGLLQMACFVGRNTSFLDERVKLLDWKVKDIEGFFEQAVEDLLDHEHANYDAAVQRLQTVLAARDEARWALENDGAETAELLAAAVRRLVSSPVRRKHLRRSAHQALAFVERE